jgi:uncharacterized membrane protein (Fun14 family)
MKHKEALSNDTKSAIITESGGRLRYYFMNIVVFSVVSYLLTKFNQNSKVISVVIGVFIFVVLPLNAIEYIFAEEDKLVVLFKRVFFLSFLNRKRIFKYDEIEKITATLKNDEKTDITAFIIDLTTKFTAMSLNVLEVEMKNGKTKYINSKIYIEKLLPIINFMQSKGVDIQIIYPDNKDL